MKQIDRLLLQSFVGPFLVAFAIALFVFLMQYLWVYIDEIIGKGAGLLLIAELVGYLSVSMMPLALPVAVLIASVMTMGNLAEHYELSSMKSAGIPLWRTMAPLMLCGVAIAGFSFLCSNYLIPVANLKARTRLYDIRKQKPSLSLEEGSFNDDFQGFSIRIGRKDAETQRLTDVMLFRQGAMLRGRLESVTAAAGHMQVTPDDRYFVLELEDGYQYQEPEPQSTGNGRRTHPFIRTKFEGYRKTFDLSEFQIDRTDETAFEGHQGMLSVRQLAAAVDSIGRLGEERRERMNIEVGRFFTPLRRRDQVKQDSIDALMRDSIERAADLEFARRAESGDGRNAMPSAPPAVGGQLLDSAIASSAQTVPENSDVASPDAQPAQVGEAQSSEQFSTQLGDAGERRLLELEKAQRDLARYERTQPLPTTIAGTLNEQPRIDSTNRSYVAYLRHQPIYKVSTYVDRAIQFMRSVRSYVDGGVRRLDAQRTAYADHVYELNLKFSFAISCFVFLFVGAPLGAIIRKGGFGYPVLASIMLFATFVVLNIMCKKLMSSFTLGPALAAWVPTSVIFPIGILLTYAAMNDRKFQLPGWTTDSAVAHRIKSGYTWALGRMGFDVDGKVQDATSTNNRKINEPASAENSK